MLDTRDGPLVGRTAELLRMRELLADAESGQSVVILVSGDAGVGKTRLLTELAAEAAGRGFTVLSGRCAELTDTVPYLPLADALRGAVTGGGADGSLQDAVATRPALARLLPDREITRQPGDLPGVAQQQLFGAVLGMLTELAASSPVLLVLEDLHWADGSTRDLVTFLSRMLRGERIALALSYRTDDIHRSHPLRPLIGELQRLPSVTAIAVGPLDPVAMAQHLTRLAAGRRDASAIDKVIRRAEGNAYFAEELLATSSAAGELPLGLADLLLARTADLSAAAQQALRAAAVAGRRVDDELVMRASGLTTAEYEGAVREAVARQLLVPDGATGLAFRHALLREAIYNDLLPGERTRLHARLAELLSDEERLAEMPGSAAELALHSLASHDVPRAFGASVQAGDEAWRMAAPADAHRHFDQALSLWERVPEPEKLGGVSRGKLGFKSALSAADSGQVGQAVKQLRGLVRFLEESAEPDVVLLCRVKERLAYFLLDVDQDTEAVAAAAAAVELLPAQPSTWERARALATHARTLLSLQDSEPARIRAEEAAAAASAASAPWVQADALTTLSTVRERAGEIEAALSISTKAVALATESDMEGVELRARYLLARLQLESGDLAGSSATAHLGVHLAERTGLSLAPFGLEINYLHYLAHFADGDWEHAQAIADRFAVRVMSVAEARLSAMALFIDVATGSARVAERRAWLEPFMADDWMTEYIAGGLFAEDAYWAGRLGEAVEASLVTIRASSSPGEGYGPQSIRPAAVGLAALADQARHARAAGQHDRAAAFGRDASPLVEAARSGAARKKALGVEGRGWLARAEAEWRRATDANDPANWQAVVTAFGADFAYEAARSRWRLAEALAETGSRDQAQQQWQLAVEAADRLGATRLSAALADLGRRARLGPWPGTAAASLPGSAAARRSPLSVLTGREAEVLKLVAAGHSNREIGAELFIAPKTVSVHVSNILAKLGAASRTEAAAIALGNGIGGPGQRANGPASPG
ncbi:MAG TPA: AAA family ATPase [Streptosporangiaceae bacterium]|nr:AAA family ATPase [Streptosporangiaceae bacterium]